MSSKIFPLRTRKLKPQHQRPMFQPDARLSARIAQDRREVERIEADRARRSAERRAAAIERLTQRAEEPPADWSDREAAWFVAHPGRNHRVRRRVDGEFPPTDRRLPWVAICQIAPGIRVRLLLNVPYGRRNFLRLVATEAGARMVFESVARDQPELIRDILEKAPSLQSASEDA